MYKIEIPEHVKTDVVRVLRENRAVMFYPQNHITFLLRVYYRYIYPIRPSETTEKLVEDALRCGSCKDMVRKLFENERTRISWGITESI